MFCGKKTQLTLNLDQNDKRSRFNHKDCSTAVTKVSFVGKTSVSWDSMNMLLIH